MDDAIRAIATTSPEYAGADGSLWCPYCEGDDDGDDWGHAEDCPWLYLARAYGTLPPSEADIQAGMTGQVRGLLPPTCDSCGHVPHWRECQAAVVGLLGTTYRCECRHRGPHSTTTLEG